MPTVTVRDLARNAAAVIQDVEFCGRLAPVTRNGKPVAALVPVDKAALEDWLLTHAAELARAAAAADADRAAGRAGSAGTKHSTLCRTCTEGRVAEVDGGSPLAAP
jgi:antitoxin (DNA-binding transcriptional repressor) of toxin-antitoxin stability system